MSDKDIKALILMIKKRYSYLNSHEKKNFDSILRITPTISERNNTIEEVKTLFEPMFAISPTSDNILQIMEQVRNVYQEILKLKIDEA